MYTFAKAVDTVKMITAAEQLLGRHDFDGLSSLKRVKKSTVRTVTDIRIERIGNELRMTFVGDGFLYNSVRIMAGTLLEIGCGTRDGECIRTVFTTKQRAASGETLPAKGLTLMSVEY